MAGRELDRWLARGVPRERLVLGVPFYGYGFGGEKATWSYRELAAAHGLNATKADVIGERCAGCLYITHNSPATIETKARLAAEKPRSDTRRVGHECVIPCRSSWEPYN